MARIRRKKNISTFILSFVDVIASAVGALMFLTIIVAINATGNEKTREEIKKVDAYVIDLENNVENEIDLNKKLKQKVNDINTELDQVNHKIEQEEKTVYDFNDKLEKLKNQKIQEVFYKNPILRKTDKGSIVFECRKDQLSFIDMESARRKLGNYMESEISQSLSVGEFTVNDFLYMKNYKVKPSIRIYSRWGDLYWSPLAFEFIPTYNWGDLSENRENIKKKNSDFLKIIDNIDPQKTFVKFFVRPDSFKIFRTARDILWENNIDSNWIPLESSEDVYVMFSNDTDFQEGYQ